MTLTFINYAIQVSILTGIFYLAYQFLFKNQSAFVLNRTYLISAVILSWIIPLVNIPIEIVKEVSLPLAIPDIIPEQRIAESSNPIQEPFVTPTGTSSSFSWWTIYWIGTILIILKSVWVLGKISLLRFRNTSTKQNSYRIIVGQKMPSFSLFNWIFIDKDTILDKDREMVLAHEIAHAKQLHAIDLLFVELVSAVLWFNPFLRLYKRSLKECHEFLADRAVLNQGFDFGTYANSLQTDYFNTRNYKLASYFKGSTLKRRILMATKRHTRYSGIKHLIYIPIVALSILLFSFVPDPAFMNDNQGVQQANNQDAEYSTNIPSINPIRSEDLTRIAAYFSKSRMHPILKIHRPHNGVDYTAPLGTPVIASGSGTIEKVVINRTRSGYGTYILIRHGESLHSFYGHLDEVLVKEGQKISRGQVIGKVGTTGLSMSPHLHFAIRGFNTPIDPLAFMRHYWVEQDEMYIGDKSNYSNLENGSFIEQFIKKKRLTFDEELEFDVKGLSIQLIKNTYYLNARDTLNGKTYAYELAQKGNSLFLSIFYKHQSCECDDTTLDAFEVKRGKIVGCKSGNHSIGITEKSITKPTLAKKIPSNRWMVDPKDSTKQVFVGAARLCYAELIKLNQE